MYSTLAEVARRGPDPPCVTFQESRPCEASRYDYGLAENRKPQGFPGFATETELEPETTMKTIRLQRLLAALSVMVFFLTAACTKEPSTLLQNPKQKKPSLLQVPAVHLLPVVPLTPPAVLTPRRTWKRQPEP